LDAFFDASTTTTTFSNTTTSYDDTTTTYHDPTTTYHDTTIPYDDTTTTTWTRQNGSTIPSNTTTAI
jgi:hypothetical protein